MVEEIIYTSAEKGLKQGSRGFCTVVSTSGMALNIAERLESMSGYRQAFPLNDPQSTLNPVNYSHVTMRLAGKKLHVLSRVADAGQDYTGRSNKLAHHIVIDSVVHLTPGPARLLADASVVVDRWDGVVRHVPARELRSPVVPSTIQLSAWKTICGDGGWAGSVAEQLLQNPAPISVIFGAGTDTLSLVREVLDLVPAPQRWNITFSTYFTRLLAGAECQLRFVLNDTPEATALRNDARARVVDLTKPTPAATGGALVTIARSGVLTPQEPAPAAPATLTTRTAIPPKENVVAASPNAAALPASVRFEQPTIGKATVDLPDIPFPAKRSHRKLILVVASLLFITVSGTLVATVMFLGKGGKPDKFSQIVTNAVPADAQQSIEENKAIEEQATRVRKEAEEKQRTEQLAAEVAEKQKREADMAAAEKTAADEAARKEAEAKLAAARKLSDDEWEKKGPFVFIGNDFIGEDKTWRDSHGQWLFELPKPGETIELQPLPLSVNNQDVKLALFPGAEHLFVGRSYKLMLEKYSDTDTDTGDKWIVKADEHRLAEYTIQKIDSHNDSERSPDCLIHFRWLDEIKRYIPAAELLRSWPLQIRVGEKSAVLLQRTAAHSETVVTWQTLVASRSIQFSTPTEIKELPLAGCTDLSFDLVITEKDHDPQRISIKANTGSVDEQDSETHDHGSDVKPKPGTKYFKLQLPFELLDQQPPVDDQLLGFGTLQTTVDFAGARPNSINPDLQLTLRLPKQDLITSFPSPGLLTTLDELANNPDSFGKISGRIDNKNNADLHWPFMQHNYDNAMKEMTSNAEACKLGVEFWYRHSLTPIPSRDKFDSPFKRKANRAKTEIVRFIPALKTRATQTQAQVDITAFKDAEKYEGAVVKFGLLMDAAINEVDEQIRSLLVHHADIEKQIGKFCDAGDQGLIEVKWRLYGEVETPDSDNGPTLQVIFLE